MIKWDYLWINIVFVKYVDIFGKHIMRNWWYGKFIIVSTYTIVMKSKNYTCQLKLLTEKV